MIKCSYCPVYGLCPVTDHKATLWWRKHEEKGIPNSAIGEAIEMHRRMEVVEQDCPLAKIVRGDS